MTEAMQEVRATPSAVAGAVAGARMQEFSKIKEVVAGWSDVRQYLRGGDAGQIVPVVIPKDRRRYGWLLLLGFALYLVGFAVFVGNAALAVLAGLGALFFFALALLWLWRGGGEGEEEGGGGACPRPGRGRGARPPGPPNLL